jgi:hypothetical protein
MSALLESNRRPQLAAWYCLCADGFAPVVVPLQYHPEASPGPHDADICFQQFYEMMKAEALVKA